MLPDVDGRVYAACQRPPRLDAVLQAPLPYREHVLDHPYKDRLLLVALMPQSGTSTLIYDCLWSLLSDNLALPYAVVRLPSVRPADLSERLQNLYTVNRTFLRFVRAGSRARAFCQNDSSYNSHVRSVAGDFTLSTALENVDDYDLNDLSRVPLYIMAIRVPVLLAYYYDTLPNYDTVEVLEDEI